MKYKHTNDEIFNGQSVKLGAAVDCCVTNSNVREPAFDTHRVLSQSSGTRADIFVVLYK